MSGLPKGWVETRLGEVCSYIQRGKSPKYTRESDIPIINQKCIRWSGIDERYLKFLDPGNCLSWTEERFLVQGDVLWNSTGTGTIGRAALFQGLNLADRVVVDSHVTVLRSGGAVSGAFLHRFIQSPSVQSAIADMQSGTTNQVELNRSEIIETTLPLPPLAEQKRIVARLDALNAKSARARSELARIETLVSRYKQAVLSKAFSGELTKRDVPAEWAQVRLGDIADVGTGATPKRGMSSYYDGGTVPWVTSGAVNQGYIFDAEEFITELALQETNCKIFPAGTLVVAMYGEGKTRGKAAVLGLSAATNQALAAIQIRDTKFSIESYVFLFLQSVYWALRDEAAGGVQPNLNLSIIKSIELPLPLPEEQHEIVRRIESAFAKIDRLAEEAKRALQLVGKLDEALLAKAFRGELVPQDENDEPAEHLLARIRAERAAAPKARRGRKAKA